LPIGTDLDSHEFFVIFFNLLINGCFFRIMETQGGAVMQKLPARYATILVPLVLTCLMTFLVAGISTVAALGFAADFYLPWIKAWLLSWGVAFPIMVFMLPLARRVVRRFVQDA
jgi:hypothetical protein